MLKTDLMHLCARIYTRHWLCWIETRSNVSSETLNRWIIFQNIHNSLLHGFCWPQDQRRSVWEDFQTGPWVDIMLLGDTLSCSTGPFGWDSINMLYITSFNLHWSIFTHSCFILADTNDRNRNPDPSPSSQLAQRIWNLEAKLPLSLLNLLFLLCESRNADCILSPCCPFTAHLTKPVL